MWRGVETDREGTEKKRFVEDGECMCTGEDRGKKRYERNDTE